MYEFRELKNGKVYSGGFLQCFKHGQEGNNVVKYTNSLRRLTLIGLPSPIFILKLARMKFGLTCVCNLLWLVFVS